jgi:anti-anti-sigma factor
MVFSREEKGDITIVRLDKRIDSSNADDFEKEIDKIIKEGKKKILFDFSGTDYISSAGLRVLLLTVKGTKKAGGKVALCSLKPFILEVFVTAGFNQIFSIYSSCNEGLTM